ncbi:hypothetical protein RUND412_007468 [Rhizina undulata]
MPPVRTAQSVKPVKTERTHEENQERAYIAASRRSDRSLEARVESARRASEIHKKRTGRALRVTEKDVLNEEMYEEEEDDLPLFYRGMPVHIRTGDWASRFDAYFAGQVARRNCLRNAAQNQYGTGQDLYVPASMYNPYVQQAQPALNIPYHMMSHRHQPYPTAGHPIYHGPAMLMNPSLKPVVKAEIGQTQPEIAYLDSVSDAVRRMSQPGKMPPTPALSPRTPVQAEPSLQLLDEVQQPSPEHQKAALPASNLTSQHPYIQYSLAATGPTHYEDALDYGPFTTSLPGEFQTFLGQSLDRDSYSSIGTGVASPYLFDSAAPLKPISHHPVDTSCDARAVSNSLYPGIATEGSNFDMMFQMPFENFTASMKSSSLKAPISPGFGPAAVSNERSSTPLDEIWQTFMNSDPC